MSARIPRKIKDRLKTARLSASLLLGSGRSNAVGNILDEYVTAMPANQNAIDLFQGQWTSQLPEEAHAQAGELGLFADERMQWAAEAIGGFADLNVLELGPLEGGHTYMMEKGGARSIHAIEANSRAFLKCLIVKEALGLSRSHFQLGDFLVYLRSNKERYDLGVANGVLYHMREPAELLYLLAGCCERVIIWTHYYDEAVIQADPDKRRYFSEVKQHSFQGFEYVTHQYNYLEALKSGSFCGGTAPFARWMYRQDILDCLGRFGFTDIRIGFDDPQTRSGPSFCVVASKTAL